MYPKSSIIEITDLIRKDKTILFDDIIQGDLGDCYFLCALCTLCEFPDKITKFFKAPKIKNGCVEVELILHGAPIKICVDDYAPFVTFDDDDQTTDDITYLSFAGQNKVSGHLWPSLLEKAWAKLNITYAGIGRGLVAEAFEVLFPAPIVSLDHMINDPEEIWGRTIGADEKNYLICADISDEGKSKTWLTLIDKMGLISNHAYTVISVRYLF